MSAFLIAKSGSRDWDLPVFSAGTREAIAVFTSSSRAARYLRENRLDRDHEVSEVTALELIDVMVAAQEEGVAYLAVNPVQQRRFAAGRSRVLPIDDKLAEFAADLARTAFRSDSFTTN